MSRSTLRRIRRLSAHAAPLIAEINRREQEWEASFPRLAEEHLLRLIAVFHYGDAQIEEPLELAYRRAAEKLGGSESLVPDRLRAILEKEHPAGDVKSKIASRLQELPVNQRSNLTPHRRPILTPLSDVLWR